MVPITSSLEILFISSLPHGEGPAYVTVLVAFGVGRRYGSGVPEGKALMIDAQAKPTVLVSSPSHAADYLRRRG